MCTMIVQQAERERGWPVSQLLVVLSIASCVSDRIPQVPYFFQFLPRGSELDARPASM